jgi:hypothetical protein
LSSEITVQVFGIEWLRGYPLATLRLGSRDGEHKTTHLYVKGVRHAEVEVPFRTSGYIELASRHGNPKFRGNCNDRHPFQLSEEEPEIQA